MKSLQSNNIFGLEIKKYWVLKAMINKHNFYQNYPIGAPPESPLLWIPARWGVELWSNRLRGYFVQYTGVLKQQKLNHIQIEHKYFPFKMQEFINKYWNIQLKYFNQQTPSLGL